MHRMSEFFEYHNLTWPEIAALPRDTPLVIPLGGGYDLRRLAEALGNPRRISLLPAIPFGWQSSGLPVPVQILSAFLGNLLDSLRDDGFSRVYSLTPQVKGLDVGPNRIVQPVTDRLTPLPSLPPDDQREKVLLFPIGHTEQHAFHLPMNTDTLIIEAIARGAAGSKPALAFALPAMPYGVSTHRTAFGGTLNAGGRAFEDFWLAVLDTLNTRGFTRFYLLSGHGGNCSFLTNVVKYAGERHLEAFIATAWLYLTSPQGIEALQTHRQSGIGGMGHACELETSLILYLRPELVHMERAVDETEFISTPSYYMDWVEGGALVANPPWEDDTQTGAYGAGNLGSAEKGRIWLQAAIIEKAAHVDEIHEQYSRRIARRREFTTLKP
jgi:creatinine amidohydrolase